jgi:hypothetical protein
VDTHGVEHFAFTVPWPGRAGFILGFRGTICPTCRNAVLPPHPPWIPPVLRCTCPPLPTPLLSL